MLESQVGPNEHIIWSGTKNKKVSVMESIFNPLLPFAALWAIFDFGIIFMSSANSNSHSSTGIGKSMMGFLIPFFLLHLMPVWLYLGGVLTSAVRAKNTCYCVTDQAVYIQHGVFNTTTERITYQQVISVGTQQSFFDKRAYTGDVVLKLDEIVYSGKHRTPHQRNVKIENIADYEDLYQMIMQYQPSFATGMPENAPRDMRSYMQQNSDQYDDRRW
ncbi:PH domain-containing protein [Ruminococcus sp.]|uniref:PH domain-containing protein n=1 Tax=Ruminococcus sp. TaxID=41978 RepID=UPI001B72481F|nr:PH domain-containing protein [Ruminococcus sp.]MBP5433538.1 PH domain-containing protein [Ruminococcus sp.]